MIHGHGMGAPVGTKAQTGKMPLSHPQGQAKQNTNGEWQGGVQLSGHPRAGKDISLNRGERGKN